jgi:hypothetical protein
MDQSSLTAYHKITTIGENVLRLLKKVYVKTDLFNKATGLRSSHCF